MKAFSTILIVLVPTLLLAKVADESVPIDSIIEQAYNFDRETFEWIASRTERTEDPLVLFVDASARYWIYQADRIDESKRTAAAGALNRAVDWHKRYYSDHPDDPDAQFFAGISYCNRARFNVEEQQWFRAYLDAREGMGMLRDLLEQHPDYQDANFALGVAECFLSDAPMILKPLARLLGFHGSAEEGIRKLNRCIREGTWTRVEAEYYLAYYYYKIRENGPESIHRFRSLVERYPNNPMFGYFLGRGYQINHQPLEALEAYLAIRDTCYAVGAEDIGNWTSYRIGNILKGESRFEEALAQYERLKARLSEENVSQEYFYRLPLQYALIYAAQGKKSRARTYLSVIRKDWDSETYDMAQDLLKEL